MYSSLFESLRLVLDPRIDRKKLYPLDFLILIVFSLRSQDILLIYPEKVRQKNIWGRAYHFSCLIE